MEDRNFKKKYNHCKIRIKQWECDFTKQNNRCPNKDDIKLAEPKIKQYYKLYWRLKSSLLEEQILGSIDDAEINTSVDQVLTEKNENSCDLKKSVSLRLDQSSESSLPSLSVKSIENKLHPVKQPRKNSEPKKWLKSASFKLFEGTSFKARNPRKAFVRKTQSNLSLTSLNDTCDSPFSSDTVSCASPMPDIVTNDLNISTQDDLSPAVQSLIDTVSSISKVTIIESNTNTISTPQTKSTFTPRNLNCGWIERCLKFSEKSLSEPVLSRDSGFESTNGSLSSPTDNAADKSEFLLSSDDDLIADSDDESSSQMVQSLKRKSTVLDESSSQVEEIKNIDEICKKPKLSHNNESVKDRLPNILSNPITSEVKPTLTRAETVKKEILENKIKSGTLNDNFVKINMKKKVFVRGKKSFNLSKHKKSQWKKKNVDLNAGGEIGGILRCYKCGDVGHYSRQCQSQKEDKLLAVDETLEDDMGLPTLAEAEEMAKEVALGFPAMKLVTVKIPEPDSLPEDLPDLEGVPQAPAKTNVPPISVSREELLLTLRQFGHDSFRPGQEDVVMRILAGKSTLLMLSTGGGKSLCYQLPAFLYHKASPSIALVVSPLVSLMDDQVANSLSFLKIGCLHTNQTEKQRANVISQLEIGALAALLVSPEAVVSCDNYGFGSVIKKLPPIAFACIDEVHCVSQWSYNFRPSYLMLTKELFTSDEKPLVVQVKETEMLAMINEGSSLEKLDFGRGAGRLTQCDIDPLLISDCGLFQYVKSLGIFNIGKVLRERLNVKTFLGLTATASKTTVASIVKELGISDNAGVVHDIPLPSYLNLAISCVPEKDLSLLKLIKSSDNGAILVYCTRREECVRLATLIRTTLRGVTAQAYHAGLAASRRKSVQKSFMQGKLQVVVATVAFGMGINKQDIRCVFHYNMPKDWESYVQEVGRAGRDGQPAKCHLLLEPNGKDLQELRRHIHSNSVERHVLRRLLARVFVSCQCEPGTCDGHEVAFSATEAVTNLDLPEENIATLLCYLELHSDNLVKSLTQAYMTCRIQSYHGARGIHRAARECPPLAVAAAQASEGPKAACLTFDVIKLARQIGWESGTVKRHLKQTEWKRDAKGAWRRSGINVSFTDLGLRVRSRGDLTGEQLDQALDYLVGRVEDQQAKGLNLLQSVYSTFLHFSTELTDLSPISKSDDIKEAIRMYFKTEKLPEHIPQLTIQDTEFDEEVVAADVRHLVLSFRDNTFNGRAVARIFHGMQSPNYPASVWFRARQWRAHLDKPFDRLQQIATREILKLK